VWLALVAFTMETTPEDFKSFSCDRSTPPPSKPSRRSVTSDGASWQDDETYSRPSPLPPVGFANCSEVWELMCISDAAYRKDVNVFKHHPVLSPQMRSILLDWLMDVCEAYNMHRETLYLATDFLDRYLALQHNILKHHLQLIGITCLFIAAKVEEIYPPKLNIFAYVTDGACTEQEILDMEIVIMTTLKWKLTPITPASWVNIFLQILSVTPQSKLQNLHYLRSRAVRQPPSPPESEDMSLVAPSYSGTDYVRALRIIDLTILDLQSFKYSYAALAAAAVYHTKGREAALSASGYKWETLVPCVNWMAPFAAVLKKNDVPDVLPGIPGVGDEARHLIQSHGISLAMLEQVEVISRNSKVCSPMTHSEGLLTPPRSSKKRKKSSPGLSDYF